MPSKRRAGRPADPPHNARTQAKDWLIAIASEPPAKVGVTASLVGRGQTDAAWTLQALADFARAEGPKLSHKTLAKVQPSTIADWLKAEPEQAAKVKLWRPELAAPKAEPAAKLPKLAKEQLAHSKKTLNGRQVEPTAPRPVTLPTCYFASRPELPMSDRERLGKDYRAPSTLTPTPAKLADDQIVLAGEAALRRIRGSAPMRDWIDIGKALLVLRKRAMHKTGVRKPHGKYYCTRNNALVHQHGFTAISKSARQTAMLVTENLRAIEKWLATLSDERRFSLNHPMVGLARIFGRHA